MEAILVAGLIAMCGVKLVLALTLTYAAGRNHFRHRRIRPAVWALAAYTGVMFLFAVRALLLHISRAAHPGLYAWLLSSGGGAVVVWASVIGAFAVLVTLSTVYPESRDRRRAERDK